MNMKKSLIATLITATFLATAGSATAAGSQCQVIYGGGEVCKKQIEFTINKMVQVPNTKGVTFVENLTINDAKYTPGSVATFKVVITNSGKEKITRARVTDKFPQFLSFVSGAGTWDANAKTLTFDVNNLEAGKSQEFLITAKVSDDAALPQNQTNVCVTNQVNAIEDDGATASDSSSLCIVRTVITTTPTPTPMVHTTTPPKSIPNTGPEMLPLLGLIPAGITGMLLRRKSKLS